VGSRHWIAGGDPYREPIGDPAGRPYVYPPLMLRAFAWCALVGQTAAVRIWTGVIVALLSLGTYACWRTRRALGLSEIPFPLAWAIVFFSTPLLFAVERGNTDCLNLMLIVGLAWLLRGRSPARDVIAGAFVAIGALYKIYPAFLVFGLVVLRRWVSVLACALTFAAIALLSLDQLIQSFHQLRLLGLHYALTEVHPTSHSLSASWKYLWQGMRLVHRLAVIPGEVAWFGTFFPLALWMSLPFARRPDRPNLLLPYFTWLAAAATFLPRIAYDYSLLYLPLTALAVWDRRDRAAIHVLMLPALLWWQPFRLPVGPKVLFAVKCLAMLALAMCLVARAREDDARAAGGSEERREAATA
jgi:hypothetical protein